MSNILIDLGYSCKRIIGELPMDGISRYALNLSLSALKSAESDEYMCLRVCARRLPQFEHELAEYYSEQGYRGVTLPMPSMLGRAYSFLRRNNLPLTRGGYLGKVMGKPKLSRSEVDLIHWTSRPEAIGRGMGSVIQCMTVYDIIPLTHPDICSQGQVRHLAPMLKGIAATGDHFIAISQHTKDSFCSYFGIDESRCSVVPLAASPEMFYPEKNDSALSAVRRKYHIPDGDYILSLAAVDMRKNLDSLVISFFDLLHETRNEALFLVLAGTPRGASKQLLLKIAENKELAGKVIIAGHVDEADLAALYSGALFFACPSLAEGFGLPALEAMQCGTAVLSSNTSSIPEVTGSAAILIDPLDLQSLTQSMYDLVADEKRRNEFEIKGLERAAEFSWDKTANATLKVYGALL